MNLPAAPTLPCPPLTITVEISKFGETKEFLNSIPSRAGVFLLETESGQTLALAATSNLRRAIASRFEPPDPAAGLKRRVDYRSLATVFRACTVGSAFEADWAYLQLARKHLPRTYQSALDRWQAWFIHVDPEAKFPQFVKTAHPGRLPAPEGECFGPFPDKHAAARYIEALQDVFDLCRYHHILVQAPNAAACAYKEMGKCPAPCDGSVSLDAYRVQMQNAMQFASMPLEQWTSQLETTMRTAADSREFERAAGIRQKIERARVVAKPPFDMVDRLDRFQFLAVSTTERRSWTRLFIIRGGWIEPVCDVHAETSRDGLAEILDLVHRSAEQKFTDWSASALENLGLVCAHLYRPRARKITCELLRIHQGVDSKTVRQAVRRISKRESLDESESESEVTELSMDSPDTHV